MANTPVMKNAIDLTSMGYNNPYTLPSDGYIFIEGTQSGSNKMIEFWVYRYTSSGTMEWILGSNYSGEITNTPARCFKFMRKGTQIKLGDFSTRGGLSKWWFIPYY